MDDGLTWRRAGQCALWVLLLALAACAGPSAPGAPSSGARATNTASGPACAAVDCAATGVSVFVEPDAGAAPILKAIKGAKESVWVEVYLLTDRDVVRALEDAAARGVDVRVLLEAHPFGGGDVAAQQTLDELNAAGARARPASPAFKLTHAKMLLVDGATAYILTANLSKSALGGSSVSANRDYGVVDGDPTDVVAAKALFLADWDRRPYTLADSRLVVSPLNSRATLAGLIGDARTGLLVEDEEMYDASSEVALIAAARRGVDVRVLLPPPGATGGYGADARRLASGGVRVRYLAAPYVHAKLVIADGRLGFVGSENFSAASLDENREVGLVLADQQALGTLAHVYEQDWALGVQAS